MLDFEKSLYNIHAEEMCIGSILYDHTVLYDSTLSVYDFYGTDTKKCFKVILELFDARKHIDVVTVHSKLFEELSIDVLYEYCSHVITTGHFKEYHDIVLGLGQKRLLLDASKNIEKMVYSDMNAIEISNKALSLVEVNHKETNENFFEKAFGSYGKGSKRIASYGIKKLDEITDGIHPGRLTVIGAKTHVGKTYVSCHITQHLGNTQDVKCMYITMEMTGDEIADGLMSNAMGLTYYDRMNKKADEIDNLDFSKVIKMQNNISIKSGTYFIEDIISYIRDGFYKEGIKIFLVDHLGLIKSKGKDTKNNEIGERTSKLKQLSLQLNINVILLVQMNRGDKMNKNAIPTMDGLRDSGNIEQDADNVILLHRNSDDEGTMDNNMTLYVQKNRVSGIKGNCVVIVYPNTFSIIEVDNPLPVAQQPIKVKPVIYKESTNEDEKF